MMSRSERRRICTEIMVALPGIVSALVRRDTPRFDGLSSCYGEIELPALPGELRRALSSLLPTGVPDARVRLLGFMRGEYMLPCPPGEGRTDEIFMALDDVPADGLTLWVDGDFQRRPSRAGEAILCIASAWRWVSPVQGQSLWLLVAPRGEEELWIP